MSRSHRKTPIFGITSARSEAEDKRLWHKRWRARLRDQLAGLAPDSDPLPIHRRAVSNPWSMAKDGKHWFGASRQQAMARYMADRSTVLAPAREALQARILAKWNAK